jgi:Putative peptidoglycan binding domain
MTPVLNTLAAFGLVLATVGGANASPFPALADEIVAGIYSTDMSQIPARGGYGAPRIAVWPFEGDDLPVPKALAAEYNDRLQAGIARRATGRLQLVARPALKTLIREIESLGGTNDATEARIADLLKNASVDILVIGRMRRDRDDIVLSYKALNVENGAILSVTTPRRIAINPAPADRRYFAAAPIRPMPTVFEAQRLLVDLGYDPGLQDGQLKPRTRRAIGDWQRDNGLPVDGRMTRRVVDGLRRAAR